MNIESYHVYAPTKILYILIHSWADPGELIRLLYEFSFSSDVQELSIPIEANNERIVCDKAYILVNNRQQAKGLSL